MDAIPRGKTDRDEAMFARLERFYDQVKRSGNVRFFTSADELAANVVTAARKVVDSGVLRGWVRSNSSPEQAHARATGETALFRRHTLTKTMQVGGYRNVHEVSAEVVGARLWSLRFMS